MGFRYIWTYFSAQFTSGMYVSHILVHVRHHTLLACFWCISCISIYFGSYWYVSYSKGLGTFLYLRTLWHALVYFMNLDLFWAILLHLANLDIVHMVYIGALIIHIVWYILIHLPRFGTFFVIWCNLAHLGTFHALWYISL